MLKRLYFAIFCTLPCLIFGQISDFENGDDGWTASGDPVSPIPTWHSNGGAIGAYCSITDASVGGTWFWEAPAKFRGNKCDAYGKYLRYDQNTSDTLGQQQYGGNPDIVLYTSAGFSMVFDNAVNPGLNWGHYEVLLSETAGWRKNTTAGALLTQAEFKSGLAAITGFKIRGEYRAQEDTGGLDNVEIESNIQLDLDGDDSSGAILGGFKADSVCSGSTFLLDLDGFIISDFKIDSLTIDFLNPEDDASESILVQSGLPGSLFLPSGSNAHHLILAGNPGATAADYLAALHLIVYENNATSPTRGNRFFRIKLWNECGEAGQVVATVPYFPKGYAGADHALVFCEGTPPARLRDYLDADADTSGVWTPALQTAGFFDLNADQPGHYAYIIYGAEACGNDTAFLDIAVRFAPHLGADTVVCSDSVLHLSAPIDGYNSWIWNTGAHSPVITASEPGLYSVTVSDGACSFSDSLRLSHFNCIPCNVYVPNVFRLDEDGLNDRFSVYSNCDFTHFSLRVYDRWGEQVFQSTDPLGYWDGRFRGKKAAPGVYLWVLEWGSTLRDAHLSYQKTGDVLLLE